VWRDERLSGARIERGGFVHSPGLLGLLLVAAITAVGSPLAAQAPGSSDEAQQTPSPPPQAGGAPPATRQASIEQQQAAKNGALVPYAPSKGERLFRRADRLISGATMRWHPYFQSAYSGGGFTLGAGRATPVSAYNYIDARASYSIAGYKRAEVEFVGPRMFNRRGELSVLGGWREATQVGFFGVGMNTNDEQRVNYSFKQPYGSALFSIFPTRRIFMLGAGVEYSNWNLGPGVGSFPSIETMYSPEELPGIDADVTYLHSQVTVGIDWRTSPGYSRRGGFYSATLHQYNDRDDQYGFQMVQYEAVQHVPILREAWVLSFRGRVQSSIDKVGQETPFFMLPSLGGGSTLRGYSSRRFHDRNTLLLQAEWRIMINRYLDMAFFYDTGKVAPTRSQLDLHGLKDDFGIGFRFHGPFSTPLRVELAKSRESLIFVFTTSAAF
jgi:hypothetical protein